ncbi:MAG: Ig-like domain-containing protein, partial [Anaerolineae bacterium]
GFAYTPTQRLAEGVHTVTAQVYDQAGNQTQSGPWSFTVVDDSAPSLGVTKYYMLGTQRAVRPASAARRDSHAPGRCGIPWTAWRQPGQASFIATIWVRSL